MTPGDARAAAALLMSHWRAGTVLPGLPDRLQPRTRKDAYAIQARLEDFSAAPLFGWKIAATSAAGQRHINVDGPLAGRILAEKVVEAGSAVSLAANRMRVAEPEFAFRLGADIVPRAKPYSIDETMAAVEALHIAIELPDSRYADFCAVGAEQLIADSSCANLFALGPRVEADWRHADLAAHAVSARIVGGMENSGTGANVLGDPRVALRWIVNELSSLDIGMRAGQIVTTGTCVVPLPIRPGDRVVADFGAFGSLDLSFTFDDAASITEGSAPAGS
jgi:2-keto-4-pentenoate hydratase